jgi:hypothetical protein
MPSCKEPQYSNKLDHRVDCSDLFGSRHIKEELLEQLAALRFSCERLIGGLSLKG